jgi:hypothetical protein
MMNLDLDTAVEVLCEAIKTNYRDWTMRGREDLDNTHTATMVADFEKSVRITAGNKYIKVISGNSVWGFIVKQPDAKFNAGDILLAAGWNAPAKNAARGNVFSGYSIAWTGPNYLK